MGSRAVTELSISSPVRSDKRALMEHRRPSRTDERIKLAVEPTHIAWELPRRGERMARPTKENGIDSSADYLRDDSRSLPRIHVRDTHGRDKAQETCRKP